MVVCPNVILIKDQWYAMYKDNPMELEFDFDVTII